MSKFSGKIESIGGDEAIGAPLAPWTYYNAELFDLEYERMFLRRWQLVGHRSDIPAPGDFLTADIGRDNVFVLRDKEGVLRAFQNVCRHRASRILDGTGNCRGVIRCPYHGWTYKFDGSLMAIPQDEIFPGIDKSEYGLHEIQLDEFHGLLFVRVRGDGPSVAEHFGSMGRFFEDYDVKSFERFGDVVTQVWDANWKVAWDNYQENYHIPIGHPGLNRLVNEGSEWEELTSGVNYGTFELKSKLSRVESERRYQEMVGIADERVPNHLKGKWVQIGMTPGLGIDFYAEMLDFFQLIPLGPEKTMVRATFYGHPNPTPEELELRALNIELNNSVNDEDLVLCARVQKGIRSHGYRPGPLAQAEAGVFWFHEMLREYIPVISLPDAPPAGSVAAENARLLELAGN